MKKTKSNLVFISVMVLIIIVIAVLLFLSYERNPSHLGMKLFDTMNFVIGGLIAAIIAKLTRGGLR